MHGKNHMKRLVRTFLPTAAALCCVAVAFAADDAGEAGDGTGTAAFLGETDLAEWMEICRNRFRRMTPGDAPLVQDAGTWPAAWEEFSPRWDSAPAERDLATWLVPFVSDREGARTVLRGADGTVLWSGATDFAKEESATVTLTGALVAEEDWPLWRAAREEIATRLEAASPKRGRGGGCTDGVHFVSAEADFAANPPELRVGLQWTNAGAVDVFAYGPLHTSETHSVTYTNDENQVVSTIATNWHYADGPYIGHGNAWEWVGTVTIAGTNPVVFVDSNFPPERGKVRYYAAAEAVDTDGDGLNDGAETFVWHTEPGVADSDGDGVGDGAEAAMGTDPADPAVSPMVTINAVLYTPADTNNAEAQWVELYSAAVGTVDLSGFRLEVGRAGGWSNAVAFGTGTVIEPGRCLLVGGSQVTNADIAANALAIPQPGRTDWPTGVRLVWGGATNGNVVDAVMLGGGTEFNLDVAGWMSPTSVWTYAGKAAVRCHPGWDTDRAEDWTWAAGRAGRNSSLEIDTDGDGLSDALEWTGSANTNAMCFGEPTSPWNADSDGDGLSDYAECVVHGTNPNAWASDGDIWPWAAQGTAVTNWPGSDSFELANGWNPLVADENENDIPDSWEMAMAATNAPGAPGAAFWLPGADSDGDGVDNLAEMGQNSNPVDAADSTPHDYTCHFESSSPGWTNGRMDNDIGFRGWVKLVFDSVAPGRCIGVKVTEGYVQEEFELAWGGADVLARFAGDTAQIQYTSAIVGANAWVRAQDAGWHPHAGATQGGEYTIAVYSGKLVPDADRDGAIDETDAGAIGPERPFRFWVNDDNDEGMFSSGAGDVPGAGLDGVGFDDMVDGPCDLEDFTPIWIDLHDFLADYPAGATCCLKHAGEAVNIVYTDLSADAAGDFLVAEDEIYGSSFQQPADSANVIPVTSGGVALSSEFLSKIRQNKTKGVLLLEGRTASAEPLQLEVRLDGHRFMEFSLPLRLSSVEAMYRWVNLRGICNGDVVRPTDVSEPSNYPDAESNGKQFVFVHGYSVDETGARAWASEMFKRLWQCGSRAMFTVVTWRGDHGQLWGWLPVVGDVTPNYYVNVVHAFESAAPFAARMETVIPGEKHVGAHSLGNMLVSSAIAEQGLEVSRYFMFNAAVPLEAYDAGKATNALLCNPDWENYARQLWASDWHLLFPANDGRRKLTWKNRFAAITNAVNFYSPMEDVLKSATPDAPAWYQQEGAWVGQEMRKGTTSASWLPGNCEGGWGFNPFHDVLVGQNPSGTFVYKHLSPLAASALTPEELREHPFFLPFDETSLFGEDGSAHAQMSVVWRQLLADAIPALSNPAGSNFLDAWEQSRNVDMYQARMEAGQSERGGGSPSEHSAIMELPFPQVRKIFKRVVEEGALDEIE